MVIILDGKLGLESSHSYHKQIEPGGQTRKTMNRTINQSDSPIGSDVLKKLE